MGRILFPDELLLLLVDDEDEDWLGALAMFTSEVGISSSLSDFSERGSRCLKFSVFHLLGEDSL